MRISIHLVMVSILVLFILNPLFGNESVKIGMNYPKTGPYAVQGLDQWRATEMAVEEINAAGGILGKPVEIVWRDSQSKPDVSVANVTDLIDNEQVRMVFGGASSGVAVAVSELCQQNGIVYMVTVAASNSVTGEKAHKHTFRVCYNAWMGAKTLGGYLKQNFPDKKYFYVTSNYTWGWSTEESMRKFTNTTDEGVHKSIKTPLGANDQQFKKALSFAKMVKPDVLVLVLFGADMSNAIRLATTMGLKNNMQIIVPILELGLTEGGGPKVMEGVIGTSDWNWQIPYKYQYKSGIEFVEKFAARYKRYPCWGAATAYTNLWEYKHAVERAKSFQSAKVIQALEGHNFTLLKDNQQWRAFDHQCVQSVYIVKCKPQMEVLKDKFKLDYFEILNKSAGENVVQTRAEWNQRRKQVNMLTELEGL